LHLSAQSSALWSVRSNVDYGLKWEWSFNTNPSYLPYRIIQIWTKKHLVHWPWGPCLGIYVAISHLYRWLLLVFVVSPEGMNFGSGTYRRRMPNSGRSSRN
jgi:hypothetical protein